MDGNRVFEPPRISAGERHDNRQPCRLTPLEHDSIPLEKTCPRQGKPAELIVLERIRAREVHDYLRIRREDLRQRRAQRRVVLAVWNPIGQPDVERAARLAVEAGLGIHAGGGFHHAFAGHGEGFCLFNDVALAIRMLQRDQRIARAAIVDLDVHHGNGTSMIFERDPSVFTFSMHQQHNYPMFKPRSALDIGLSDRVPDDEYNAKLREALPQVLASNPQVIFYLAGADPFEGDQLGGLALTRAGLLERDRIVFDACRSAGLPVVVTLAGGYARRLEDTVAIHRATIELAARTFPDAARTF